MGNWVGEERAIEAFLLDDLRIQTITSNQKLKSNLHPRQPGDFFGTEVVRHLAAKDK